MTTKTTKTRTRDRGSRVSPQEIILMARLRRRGMTLREIAEALGWDASTVSRILRGNKRPRETRVHRRPTPPEPRRLERVRCLRCDIVFESWDRRRNRICPACTLVNAGESLDEHSIGWL